MNARIKVLRIQHNFVEPTNHRLLDELALFEELEVHALCPVWGVESGSKRILRKSPRPDLTVGRTIFTFHYSTTFYVQRLAAMIRDLKPDIINIHDEPWSLTTGQALFYRKMFSPRSKVVFCSAQNIFKNYPFPFIEIERWNHRVASAGYGCCEGVKETARAKGFEGRFDVIPLGLDPELFDYRPRDGRIEGRPFVAGYVGQVLEEKGVFTLLRAAALLDTGARFTIVGPGADTDRARAFAKKMSLEGRVEFTGSVTHTDVARLMDGFDVLVVPSQTTRTWKEQFGRVIVEAMSRGVPVIGSDSGSVPEVIGHAGIVFPEKDDKKLAECIQRLMENPRHLAEMSELGRDRVMRHYTWKRVAEMNRDLYHYAMSQ